MSLQEDCLLARPTSQSLSYHPFPSQTPKALPTPMFRVTSPQPPVPRRLVCVTEPASCCAAIFIFLATSANLWHLCLNLQSPCLSALLYLFSLVLMGLQLLIGS